MLAFVLTPISRRAACFVAFTALSSCTPMPIMQTPDDAFDSAHDATDAGIDAVAADDGTACSATTLDWGGAGDRMFPGSDCLSCHRVSGSARTSFTAAGTVFSGIDCPAGLAGVRIEIQDHNGQMVALTSNDVGNFFTSAPLVLPLTTRAIWGGRTVMMTDAVTDGSCNSCHARGDASAVGFLTPSP